LNFGISPFRNFRLI